MKQAIPNGWKLVPIEPTEAMHKAANREWDGRASARSAGVYQAMLAAAPEPPQSTPASVGCWSCGKPYSKFGLDVNIPRSQWLAINQNDENGLLCAACIVNRGAELIPGVSCAHLVFEVHAAGTSPPARTE